MWEPILVVPLEKSWSDEARLSALEHRLAEERRHAEVLKSRVLPALRNRVTGDIYTGARGLFHVEVAENHGYNEDDVYGQRYNSKTLRAVPNVLQRGFFDPLEKKFHDAEHLPFDAGELMTRSQRRARGWE